MADNSIETITIGCPVCGDSHLYNLEVERSVVVYNRLPKNAFKERVIRFTRLFVCPVKQPDFQATFILSDIPHSPIRTVNVLGIAK